MISKYEAMIVLKPDLEEETMKNVVERFVNVITDNGGEVTDIDAWGRRKLAYEINDFTEGFYVLLKYKSEDLNAELERNFRIVDAVLRYLVIKEEE